MNSETKGRAAVTKEDDLAWGASWPDDLQFVSDTSALAGRFSAVEADRLRPISDIQFNKDLSFLAAVRCSTADIRDREAFATKPAGATEVKNLAERANPAAKKVALGEASTRLIINQILQDARWQVRHPDPYPRKRCPARALQKPGHRWVAESEPTERRHRALRGPDSQCRCRGPSNCASSGDTQNPIPERT